MNLLNTIVCFYTPGPFEIGALAIIGLLLFGRRLPQVGRNLGRSIVEFKKGIKGMTDEIEKSSNDQVMEAPDRDVLTQDNKED